MGIFDLFYDTYKIPKDKKLRMIEMFAGYGSQSLSVKYLGLPFEHHKICEWAIPSIIAYAELHKDELEDYGKDFTNNLSKEELANILHDMGVSNNYSEPSTLDYLMRLPDEKLRRIYNSIKWTHNLVDISRVKGVDLNIVERNKYEYICSYSFPC